MTSTPDPDGLGDEQVWHLQDCPLLSGIGGPELAHLRDVTVVVKLLPQDRLLPDPDDPMAVWLVRQGLLSLTYGDAAGGQIAVPLGPGDLFGAIAGAQGFDYGRCVAAWKPTVLWRLTQPQVEALLRRYPDIGYQVAKVTLRRVVRLRRRLTEIMGQPVRVRVAALLLTVAAQYGLDLPDGARSLGLAVAHDDLARLVGSSRQVVSRVMEAFRDAGWVRAARKRTELVDLAALQHIADAWPQPVPVRRG